MSPKNGRQKNLCLIILIVALILRLVSLNQSFWLDEAIQVSDGSKFSVGDFNPPLYHLLLYFWLKFLPLSEATARFLSVLLGTGTVFLVWQLGGWLPAILLATSPLHIYYSQEARMYILSCFTTLFAFQRFLIFLKKQDWQRSFIFSLSLILMSFSHFLTLFTLPVFFLLAVKKIKDKKKASLPFLLLFFAYLVYFPVLLAQLKTGLTYKNLFPVWGSVVGGASLKAAGLFLVKFVMGRIAFANRIVYGLVAAFSVLFYWGIAFWGLLRPPAIFSTMLVFPPLFGFLLSFFLPVFSYFRFLFVLPFFYLTIGKVVRSKKTIFLLLFFNLAFSGIYLINSRFHREDWKGAVAWLHDKNKNFNAPVFILGEVAKPFEYYDQGESRLIYVEPESVPETRGPVVYLVSYALPIFDPEDKIRKSLALRGLKIARGESFRQVGIEMWRIKGED